MLLAVLALYGSSVAVAEDALHSAGRALDEASRDMDKANQDLNAAVQAYEANLEEMDANLNDQGVENVMIELLYPAGKSPQVFTSGWVFGARAVYMPKEKLKDENAEPLDISDAIEWSGSGSFQPKVGKVSRPTFNGPGANTIVLSVVADGQKVTRTIKVSAVSPSNYAHVGSNVQGRCSHGCPACPHNVVGHIAAGSTTVFIDGKGAARVGDGGKHASCCGANEFTVAEGDPKVLINGKPAARYGDKTNHCGGPGIIVH
jgi:uncharacterized Zn-binding protein involved in type VI secretion